MRAHGPARNPATERTRPAVLPPLEGTGQQGPALAALQRTAGNSAVVQVLQRAGHPQAAGTVVQRAPSTATAHAQGEHIFNGLDSLLLGCGDTFTERIDRRVQLLKANEKSAEFATKEWNFTLHHQQLTAAAHAAGTLRDNRRFRSASSGAPVNADGSDPNSLAFGGFSARVREILADCGTPQWGDGAALEALRGSLVNTITDQVARGVKRNTDLQNSADRGAFDTWYQETQTAMEEAFERLVQTSKAVHWALYTSVHAAYGYEERDDVPDAHYRA